MGISTDRGYAIIIRHRFAGVTVRSLRFNPVSVPPHLSTEIQGASIRSPLLPIPPGCSSVRKLGLQPWGMHGVVKRCSRLPWRPIVTRHPSPLISPTFYPHARWSGGRTTSSHTKPKTLVSYYAAKPVNCLLYVEFRPSILSPRSIVRATNGFFYRTPHEQDVTLRQHNGELRASEFLASSLPVILISYRYAAGSLAAVFAIQFRLVRCKNNYIWSLREM